jgi:REP element-mobilizing transposase RayT
LTRANREAIFGDEQDWRMFLGALTEDCGKTQWQVDAYCRMRNHLHLVPETQETKALRRMREQMGRLAWEAGALRQAGKGDERQVRLAARIRKDTTMSLKWIAQHLEMGRWTHVSTLLGAKRKQESLKSED